MTNLIFAITTYNEEKNIEGCIKSLLTSNVSRANIVLIDSFSTDATVEIAQELGVAILQNTFVSMAKQRNYVLQCVQERFDDQVFVLIMDADERVTLEFVEGLQMLLQQHERVGRLKLRVCRKMMFQGTWMKHGANYPTFIDRCCRCDNQSWTDVGHGEVISDFSETIDFSVPLIEDDRKGVESFMLRHIKYAKDEAQVSYTGGKQTKFKEALLRRRGSTAFILAYIFYLFIVKGIVFRTRAENDYALLKIVYELHIRIFKRYE